MATYKITDNTNVNWASYQQFPSIEAAQLYVESLGSNFSVVASDVQVYELSDGEKAAADIGFGKMLSFDFLTNEIGKARTPSDVESLANRFAAVSYVLEKGAIKAARVKILEVPTDELFTVEDMNRYIAMIDEYLAMQYA